VPFATTFEGCPYLEQFNHTTNNVLSLGKKVFCLLMQLIISGGTFETGYNLDKLNRIVKHTDFSG
jgi:hypothetical protein